MKKKSNSKKAWVIATLSLVIVLLALVAVAMGMRFFSADQEQEEPQSTTEPTVSVQNLTVSTPYCDFTYPGKWKEQLHTQYSESDDGGALTFLAKIGKREEELFSVIFSSSIDTVHAPVGVLTGGEAPVMVSLKLYDLETDKGWTGEEMEMLYAMQDDCNYLTEQLQNRPDFDGNYEPYFAPEEVRITTPFCTLAFPGEWSEQIWWEFIPSDNGGSLHVYGLVAAEDAPLFTLYFGNSTEEAIPVGSLKIGGSQQPISLAMAEPENADHWTTSDWDDYAAKQEIINDLMASVMKNPDFSPTE